MSNAIDWASTVAALAAYTTGGNGAAATALSTAISTEGAVYDTAYAGTGVDAAKGTWMALALAEWNQANHDCRYVESLNGGSPAAVLSVDYYDPSALLARLAAAMSTATTYAPAIVPELKTHVTTVTAMWAGTQDPAGYFQIVDYSHPGASNAGNWTAPLAPDPKNRQPWIVIGTTVTPDPYLFGRLAADGGELGPLPGSPTYNVLPSVRALELPVAALVAQATLAMTMFAYV
jgi:hypothetical protein